MGNRTRVAMGSALGALALHVVMVACGSAGPASSPGDGGMLADVRDAIVDAVGDVLDAETPDAHAGGDGGTQPACNCVEPPSASFSGGAVTRDGVTTMPAVDFSTASVGVTPARADDGSIIVSVAPLVGYLLTDGARVSLQCTVNARLDGSVIERSQGDAGTYDSSCFLVYSGGGVSGSFTPSSPALLSGARITVLTQNSVEISTPPVRLPVYRSGSTSMPAGDVTIGPVTVRANSPLAAWLTPPRAYRP